MVDESIVRTWAENSGEAIDFLVGLGAEIDDIIPDFQPDFPGAGTRSHHIAGMGPGLFAPLRDEVESLGIEVLTETSGKALVADAEGRVLGIKAESDGSELFIKAQKAVVLATGGFVYDEEMVLHFLKNDGMSGVGCPACEGDGIRMGMALGANLKAMNEVAGTIAIRVPGQVIAVPSMLALAGFPFVMVNKAGKRFVDEELPYDRGIIPFDVYDPVKMEYSNIPAYAIFDDDTFHLSAIGYSSTPGAVWSTDNLKELEAGAIVQADSIRELAAAVEVDPDGLEETVNTWNADAAAGQDTQFGRTLGLAPIAKAPFYAANHYPGVWDTAGGLEVNEKAQVVNVFGEVIPGLYAAGTTAATIIGHIYPISGTAIGGAITFGRSAGQNAAAEEPWE
jgi:succinate dehydrogenase/fumarate reductase flavoprotein subunit